MKIIERKINRIRNLKAKPRVLDLFAGCGGISLGFHSAGFEIKGAIEYDDDAAKTHANNFHAYSKNYEEHSKAIDITKVDPEEYVSRLFPGEIPEESFDVIVGGPPCQAFARVGRAKLREVSEHPEAFLQDHRSNLYLRYLQYVAKLKPIALLMENVPDVLNFGGHNIAEEVCEVLASYGYICKYTLLNSVYYGVPQMRERMILVAYAKEVCSDFEFPPKPTHWIDLPVGYHGSRQVALQTLRNDLFTKQKYFVPPPSKSGGEKVAVTARDAIGDLPIITDHLEGKLKRGARRFDSLIEYDGSRKISEYAQKLKNWKGFENINGIKDHVIRYLPRDYKIFAEMKPGDQYPEAHKTAIRMFKKALSELKPKPKEGSVAYQQLWEGFVPPYSPDKFPNKWRKMEEDQPARTLMAHLGKDSYSHIHYDSNQARTISVREAARLQSFPDGFIFSGTMNPAFKQIGNSVPPLFARALAYKIMSNLLNEENNVTEVSIEEVDRV
jgi:DNA (cytosine-5)-methyltransferase 1